MNIKEYNLSEIDLTNTTVNISSLEYAVTLSKLYCAEFDRDLARKEAKVWKVIAVAFVAVATLLTLGLI